MANQNRMPMPKSDVETNAEIREENLKTLPGDVAEAAPAKKKAGMVKKKAAKKTKASKKAEASEAPPKKTASKKAEKEAKAERAETRKASLKRIQVVALREGFYDNMRRKEGDKFAIADESELGEWMEKI